MRKTMGEAAQLSPALGVSDTAALSAGFGHPLDMLARTAANTHSPDKDRFTTGNTTLAPSTSSLQRPAGIRIVPPDAITTTWSTDISGIDPVERGWLDLDDAKTLFERCVLLCQDLDQILEETASYIPCPVLRSYSPRIRTNAPPRTHSIP